MTDLEKLRGELNGKNSSPYKARWQVHQVDDRFVWLMDGERAVALLDRPGDSLELRCAGPSSPFSPAELPRHYHIVTQKGVRILYQWRLKGKGCGDRGPSTLDFTTGTEGIRIHSRQPWSDGTISDVTLHLFYDPAWDGYVVEVKASLKARRVLTALEYCNVLPAGIGDSRPGLEKYPFTFWRHPDGYRKMLKNPLWFCSAGAQDYAGEKRIASGGFIGFGPEDHLNPVIEVVSSSPDSGCMTCDNLQDEHVMALPPAGIHASTGWFKLEAHYRLFSIPLEMAEGIVRKATLMNPGAFLAWKFQYPPTPELPENLKGVELPGSPFYGHSDWSRGIPWDEPYNGRLWTASPDPAAAIHFDRKAGAIRVGSIRIRVEGNRIEFRPSSGHTLHTEAGVRYRMSARIRTEGRVQASIALIDMRYRPGDGRQFPSAIIMPDSNWTPVTTEFTALGDDAPFAETLLCAEGHGQAWFSDLSFVPV